MSWEAESWARQQRTGDPVTKAVLVGIANWMNPKGDECQVSLRRLADEVEISLSTVRRHIRRLEEMGLLIKSPAFREDGGQGWSCFAFPTYRPPKVSHVEPTGKRSKPPVNLTPPPCQNDTGEGVRLEPSPVSDWHGEGVTADTPETCKGVSKSPPTPPPGGNDVGEKRIRGERIAEDWSPPAIEELPPQAKAKARQWPAGAYQAEADAFRDFWLGEARAGARKLDWKRAWCNRINEITGRVLRDAKNGVKHTLSPPPSERAPPKALDSSREGKAAQQIRDGMRKRLGEQIYDQWITPSRLDIDGGTLTLVAVSQFASNYQRDNFPNEIGAAMHAVLGPDADLRFHHERPPA